MSRLLQVIIILYFLCAGVLGCVGMIYANGRTQFSAALGMSMIALYALIVIRRYERSMR